MKEWGLSVFAAALLALAGVSAAAGAERPSAAIVFDSSNSMWRQIDGANKVVMLREALGERLKEAGELDLAVLTFGVREEAACSAIETVVPLGPVDAARYSQAIGRIAPGKGATPLARALREAAAAIDHQNRPATIIVVADGLDNCRTDPCAAAAELKAVAPGLTIHAIAFDRRRQEDLAGLACMASETGGRFFAATSREELDTALRTALVAARDASGTFVAARADRQPAAPAGETGNKDAASAGEAERVPLPPEPPGEEEKAADAATEPENAAARIARQTTGDEPVGAANLRLRALLTGEGAPVTTGLVWRVFDTRPDAGGNFNVVARGTEAAPVFRLRSGRYVVHVAYGRASTTREVEIADTDIDENVVLNAGFMRLSAHGPDGEELAENDVSFSVYSSEQDQFGERRLILTAVEPDKIIRLNAGTYQVVSQYGDANAVARGDVQIEPGRLSDVVIDHKAAMITLKLVRESGGEALADTSWSVLSPQGDIVAESVGAFPSHLLAAGDYSAVARHDGRAYSRPFTVESGLDREIEIVTGSEEAAR